MSALLEVEAVTAGYRPDLPIITEVSVAVGEGELVTIIGPNGAGKSTLIKAIAGLLAITAGSVRLGGAERTNLEPSRMAEAGIAYVPQTDNIFATLTVEENLRVGAQILRGRVARERIAAAYEAFPALTDYRRQRAAVLSDLAIAPMGRSFVGPDIQILDEDCGLPAPGKYHLLLKVAADPSPQVLALSDHFRADHRCKRPLSDCT